MAGIYMFSDTYQCDDIKREAEMYVEGQFMKVLREDEFLTLPKDILVHFLSSEKLRIEQELQVCTNSSILHFCLLGMGDRQFIHWAEI